MTKKTIKNSQLKEVFNIKRNGGGKSNIVISLKNVGKKYFIHHEKPTLSEDLGQRLLRKPKEEYWALKNINLNIYKGEKVGLYGPNGAGKTTLLKIIAGISTPTLGTVRTKGRVVSLIDLESGFHLDLSGYENILLNGMIIGMPKQQIKLKASKIIDFADIGDFISAPLYTYSNGMRLRLGFSIAVHSDPDILILDELISVGDVKFRAKSEKAIEDLYKSDKTIILVSQWLRFLKSKCTRVVYVAHL